jgi:glycerate kinase
VALHDRWSAAWIDCSALPAPSADNHAADPAIAFTLTEKGKVKILIAPNAFKGSCSASAAARAMARGLRRVLPAAELVEVPVADGGDGLVAVVIDVMGAESVEVRVTGPRFQPVTAPFAWLPHQRTAVIEMALASGLALLPEADRVATETTTRGTGELMIAALDLGAEQLIVGLGGSATNDGGIGMAAALGFRFADARGNPVAPTGAGLRDISRIDPTAADARLARVRVEAVCDVDNPLTGPKGATRVYGPQKGASPEQVELLDAGLDRLADLIERDLGKKVRDLAGAGAAGGLGAGLVAFCNASLRPGAELVLELVELERHLAGADLVLTGEGRIDAQTGFGKAPGAVGGRARRLGIPCIAIAGSLGTDVRLLWDTGIEAAVSLCPGPVSLAEAQARSEELLTDAAEQVLRIFLAGHRKGADAGREGNDLMVSRGSEK